MDGTFGVVNWFTKARESVKLTPVDTIKGVRETIKNDEPKTLEEFAQAVSETLQKTEGLSRIAADTRLPVCSLYHHLRNTTAIAVCRAIDEGWERKKVQALRTAALLHDIGKIESYMNHVESSVKIVEELMEPFANRPEIYGWKDEIIRFVSKHHKRDGPTGDENVLANADSIASAADRVYEVFVDWPDGSRERFAQGESMEVTIRSKDAIFPHKIRMNPEISGGEEFTLGKGEERNHRKVTLKSEREFSRWESVKILDDKTVNGELYAYLGSGRLPDKTVALFLMDISGIQRFIMESKRLPLMRGGSEIVRKVEEEVSQILAEKAAGCEEVVLFSGGGKVMGFLPVSADREAIEREVKGKVKELSSGGLEPAILIREFDYNKIGGGFDGVLEKMFENIIEMKNRTRALQALSVKEGELCEECRKGKGTRKEWVGDKEEKLCEVCYAKLEAGREGRGKNQDEFIVKNEFLNSTNNHVDGGLIPRTTEDLGAKMATVQIDGNMIGVFFTQTMTPAEYNYKSESFDRLFRETLKKSIAEMWTEHMELLHAKNAEKKEHIGLEVIYAGGDDVFLLINAKAALEFVHDFMQRIKTRFSFKGREPLVTISAGIAVADSGFPVYFLQERAEGLMSEAKREFRKEVKTNPETGIFIRPAGSLAVSAVSSSMPVEDSEVFVFGLEDKSKDERVFSRLRFYLNGIIEADEKSGEKRKLRQWISTMVGLEEGEVNLLDTVKYLYSRASKKEMFSGIEEVEGLVSDLKNKRLVKDMKMLTPMVWGGGDEG